MSSSKSGCCWLKSGERVNYKSRELIEMIMQAATDDVHDGNGVDDDGDGDGVDDDDRHLLLHESVHDWALDSWQLRAGPFVNNPCWDSRLWPLMMMFCADDDDEEDDDVLRFLCWWWCFCGFLNSRLWPLVATKMMMVFVHFPYIMVNWCSEASDLAKNVKFTLLWFCETWHIQLLLTEPWIEGGLLSLAQWPLITATNRDLGPLIYCIFIPLLLQKKSYEYNKTSLINHFE